MELQPGESIDGRYRVTGTIGAGGMARVYAVRDERLGVRQALKVLTIPRAAIQERLVQEGRVQASLRHPNVLNVSDIVTVEGCPGLVMELVEGPTLELLLAAGLLPRDDAVRLARQIVSGVRAAHDLGLVHRDLKPGNILLAPTAEGPLAKIADFGLVKLVGGDDAGGTRSGMAMGTPRYMAPEQVRDAKTVDHRADVFSLGCILFELFCGTTAFDGGDSYELFNAVVEGRYDTDALTQIDPDLSALIGGCLAPDREQRIQSCEAILDALPEPASPWSPTTLQQVRQLTPDIAHQEGASTASLGGGETWAGSFVEPTPAPQSSVAATTPPRKPLRWLFATLAVLAALAAFLVMGPLTGGPDRFTAEGPPEIHDEQVVVDLFDEAWRQWQQNRDEECRATLDLAIAESPTDPAVWLLAAASDLLGYQFEKAAERLERGVELAEGQSGPVPDLLRLLDDGMEEDDLDWWVPEIGKHLETYPDDLLARQLQPLPFDDTPPDEEMLDALLEADPTSIQSHQLRALLFMGADQLGKAREACETGLRHRPNAAPLMVTLAEIELATGNPERALELSLQASEIDANWPMARVVGGVAALRSGNDDVYERLLAASRAPDVSAVTRGMFAARVGHELLGQGRLRESTQLQEAALDDDLHASRFLIMQTNRLNTAVSRSFFSTEDFNRILRQVERSLLSRSMPDNQRARMQGALGAAQGIRALRRGKSADAFRASAASYPEFLGLLDNEIAFTQRDLEHLSQPAGRCAEVVHRAELLWHLQEPRLARTQARAVLARRQCDRHNNPAIFAVAAGIAALSSDALGDAQSTRRHLDQVRDVWSRADADLPLVQDLMRLDPTIAREGALGEWIARRPNPLMVGVVPFVGSNVLEGEVKAFEQHLTQVLGDHPNARVIVLDVDPEDEERVSVVADAAGVDQLVRAQLSQLGARKMLVLQRHDLDSDVHLDGEVRFHTDGELGTATEGLLLALFTDDYPRRTRDGIRSHMKPVREGAAKCYRSALERSPAAAGTLRLRWTVLASGRVGEARVVEDEVADPELRACVLGLLRATVFPPKVAEVTFPFHFSPD